MQYLNVDQVGEKLSMSVRTVWRLVKKPDFPKPTYLSCRMPRWDAAELDAWMKAQKAAA